MVFRINSSRYKLCKGCRKKIKKINGWNTKDMKTVVMRIILTKDLEGLNNLTGGNNE